MILVDIYVPVIDRIYDFLLDGSKYVDAVIEDIADMICQKEQWQIDGDIKNLSLWITSEHRRLSKNLTLADNGIISGMRLMLV